MAYTLRSLGLPNSKKQRSPYELESKLLKGCYIGDHIAEYYRYGESLTIAHMHRHARIFMTGLQGR